MSNTTTPDPAPSPDTERAAALLAETARTRLGYGGWAITRLREAGGEETRRFEAVLTLHGKPVVHVSNGGEGSMNRYQPIASGAEGRDALTALEAWAVDWNATSEFAGYGDVDVFVDRLVEVASLSRTRKVLFLLDDQDYWCGDDARTVVGMPDRAEALAYIRHQYPDRRVRVWNRNVSDWVLLD